MSTEPPYGTPWADMVAPLVAKCEVAAAFDMQAVWNPEGAAALGKVLKAMADKLDARLVAAQSELKPTNPTRNSDDLHRD